jgi:hypothetical protein
MPGGGEKFLFKKVYNGYLIFWKMNWHFVTMICAEVVQMCQNICSRSSDKLNQITKDSGAWALVCFQVIFKNLLAFLSWSLLLTFLPADFECSRLFLLSKLFHWQCNCDSASAWGYSRWLGCLLVILKAWVRQCPASLVSMISTIIS